MADDAPNASVSPRTEPDETPPAIPEGLEQRRNVLTPHDWDKPWKSPFLVALSQTRGNASAAARHAGVARSVVYEERKRDPEFAEAWREADEVAVELLEQIAYTRATVGVPRRITRTTTRRDATGNILEVTETVEEAQRLSDGLLRDQLRAAKPHVYGDRIQHSGIGGEPIQVEVGPRVRTADRLLALYELALEQGWPVQPPPELTAGNGTAEAQG